MGSDGPGPTRRQKSWITGYKSGQRVMREVLDALEPDAAPSWTWTLLERIAVTCRLSPGDLRANLQIIAAERARWIAAGRSGVNRSWVAGTFRTGMITRLASKYSNMGDRAGEMGSMDILDPPPPIPRGMTSPDLWIAPLLKDDGSPTQVVVDGTMGAGKSSLAMLMASRLAANGRHVATTIPMTGVHPDKVHQVRSVRDVVLLLADIYENAKDGEDTRLVLILDEAGAVKATGRRSTTSRDAKDMDKWITLSRKFGVDHVLIAPEGGSIARGIVDNASVTIHVERKGVARITTDQSRWPDLAMRLLRIGGIPPSPTTFDTFGVAMWMMDGVDRLWLACEAVQSAREAVKVAAESYPRDQDMDTTCAKCGERFATPRGLSIHDGKTHAKERAAAKAVKKTKT